MFFRKRKDKQSCEPQQELSKLPFTSPSSLARQSLPTARSESDEMDCVEVLGVSLQRAGETYVILYAPSRWADAIQAAARWTLRPGTGIPPKPSAFCNAIFRAVMANMP